jgi:glycosyltransferase involved in cell wall biosynthesis
LSRRELGLPEDKFLVLVGAFDFTGSNKFLKGFHHYEIVKEELLKFDQDCVFVEIGVKDIKEIKTVKNSISFPFIGDQHKLAKIYQAVDTAFIPSLKENLSQIGTEAQSSGVPVIAFDVGGNKEICLPNKSGFIIEPFNTHQVVEKILALKANEKFRGSMSSVARNFAKENWDSNIIVPKYIDALNNFKPLVDS